MRRVDALLDPAAGPASRRRAEFEMLQKEFSGSLDSIRQRMAGVMASFLPGLFAGAGDPEIPSDNLDLERWFRTPKGHERHIHGRAHAGARIVKEGPSLVLALDAHLLHPEPFSPQDLLPYARATQPACQREAVRRQKVMRKARSRKYRPDLLAELERRYLGGCRQVPSPSLFSHPPGTMPLERRSPSSRLPNASDSS
ncbi:MAG: hypothetical protein N3A38_07030 [Planctomycetota bacterium]|nr:hypothetical protein [Planctomycetota bacterium]